MNQQRRGFLKGLAALIPLAILPVTVLGHEGEQRTTAEEALLGEDQKIRGTLEKIEAQPGEAIQWYPRTHIFTFPNAKEGDLALIREYLTSKGFSKDTTLIMGGPICEGMEVRVSG